MVFSAAARKEKSIICSSGGAAEEGSLCLLSKAWDGGYCGLEGQVGAARAAMAPGFPRKAQAGHGSLCDIHT